MDDDGCRQEHSGQSGEKRAKQKSKAFVAPIGTLGEPGIDQKNWNAQVLGAPEEIRPNFGFNQENLILFELEFTKPFDTAKGTSLFKELLTRLEALPPVHSASLSSSAQISARGHNRDRIDGCAWRGLSSARTQPTSMRCACAGTRIRRSPQLRAWPPPRRIRDTPVSRCDG